MPKLHPASLAIGALIAAAAPSYLIAGCSSDSTTPASDAGTTPPPMESGASPPVEAGSPEDAGPPADTGIGYDANEIPDGASGDDDDGPDSASPPLLYTNPVLAKDFPDPFVLRQGSTYYAFGTNAAGSNIQAASSTDLAHWTSLPDALPNLPAWAAKNAGLTWAPSVLALGPSTFVLFYTARDTAAGFQCISRAVATSPAGPYEDSSTAPFECQVSGSESFCGSIDPSPFVDTNGAIYLVWKSDENASACAKPPRLWSAPLNADASAMTGPPAALLMMDQTWQQPIIEGPSMTAVNGRYFLLYSANNYESASYAMGYATCLSPTGPCENVSVSGPFVSSAGAALGPGGGEFFADTQGSLWLAYHAWTAPTTTYAGGGARSLRIDRLEVSGGVLSLDGPTTMAEPVLP
ncbi:MAG TPA: glycoside hydrolase family 43 protein [Polyangiaceae bacterium]